MMSKELFDKSKDNQIRQNGLIMNIDEVVDLLNSQSKLISAYQYEFLKMRKENEQIVKIGLKWQGENPCATCAYPDPNVQKLCCAYVSPILIEEARESFVQGLCVNYKRIRGL